MKSILQVVQNLLKPYIDNHDNAVAGNIAPVETDASSASQSYAVGKQLILDGVLYDVTSPITAGDPLVAEGAGANIAIADDITTQIANHTVTTDAVPTKGSTNPVQSGGVYNSEKATREVIAPVEEDATSASQGYAQGAQLILGGVLYDVTATITQGDALTVGTNIVAADDVVTQFASLNSAFTNNVNVNGSKNKLYLDLERLISDNTGGTWNNNKYTYHGGEFTINEDSITFGGTPTNVTSIYFMLTNVEIPPEKYVLSGLADCTNIMWGILDLFKDGVSVQTFTINSKNNTEIDFSSYTYDTVRVEIKRTANNVAMSGTANVMLCLKSDWDLDNTFAPHSKSNLQLTKDSVTWNDLSEVGAVNLAENKGTTTTHRGITFTVNADGTVTASGTNDGTGDSTIILNQTAADHLETTGIYKLSGCPSGGSDSTYYLVVYQGGFGADDYGNGVVFTNNNYGSLKLACVVKSGTDLATDITFKPMITPVSYNGPYVPYAKTNKELTEETTTLSETLTSSILNVGLNYLKYGKIVEVRLNHLFTADYTIDTNIVTGLPKPTSTQIILGLLGGNAASYRITTNGELQLVSNATSGQVLGGTLMYIAK